MKWVKRSVLRAVAWLVILAFCWGQTEANLQGSWKLLLENGGISSMHAVLLHTNRVLMFDRLDRGPSNITRTDPACTNVAWPLSFDSECWAHSVEYDIATNKVRPLHLVTDTWCSSGAILSDGTLLQTGGGGLGENTTRTFKPCSDHTCDWVESTTEKLSFKRWYASNQILPDNRIVVVGGRQSFSYEFVPKKKPHDFYDLNFLLQTTTNVIEENNLYPFVHLSSDGNLFIFANNESILVDYKTNQEIRRFPQMPGGGARNYPSTGSSVMLPLDFADNFARVEIMICGGTPLGNFIKADQQKVYLKGLNNCGRIEVTSENPVWQMENMLGPRLMADMIILPTGEILLINGAQQGSAGWQDARVPRLNPWLYRPAQPEGNRFTVLAPSSIPRMYHSTANLLPDGRILVAGSNPNDYYNFTDDVYSKTELRVEAYSPYYLDQQYDLVRPSIQFVGQFEAIPYASIFKVQFTVGGTLSQDLRFHAYAPPFNTHSVSMSQRMLSLAATPVAKENGLYSVFLMAPPTPVAAPSGYYLLYVVNGGIPSQGHWIRFV
ncbi:hypothetical protein SUGI_0087440 [Cryptomeria japonica]|uniref:aldehyde oxidase GLOX-like n=1 Tax=Cryptomeria japonica TaxID=3369 RepID=UPI002408E235|nr:aldehyde oxidase GLOX-like [Cryptomeria japonica]GLJ08371.1 hypothetical protein SUGI_0087440 [Cryptomeria japonica]